MNATHVKGDVLLFVASNMDESATSVDFVRDVVDTGAFKTPHLEDLV